VPWRAPTLVHFTLCRRASRPQLKRNPLGSTQRMAPAMPLTHFVTRALTLVASFVAVVATSAATRLAGQELQLHPDIPGVYQAGECHPLPVPAELPGLDSVLDSAAVATALKSAGVNKRLVVGLRLGAFAATPRVRLIEKKVSDEVADRALEALDAAIRIVAPDRDWVFRLRVEANHELAMRLERSELCAATPAPRPGLVFMTARVSPDSLAQLRRTSEEATRRRKSLVHDVLVDAKGEVVALERVHSSGDATIDENEAAALQRRRFTPTKLDGVAVVAWVELRGDR
jgi:hypothetical protein